jgi:hypothetical protein
MSKLKAIGYWWAEDDWMLPHPKWLVQADWQPEDRTKIVGYLRSGHQCMFWFGHSWCRLGCDNDTEMGTSCVTDGIWIWPEGLAHYLEHHGIRLPDEFVDTMRQNGWKVPETAKLLDQHLAFLEAWPGDCSFWIDWCQHQGIPMGSFWFGLLRRPHLWKVCLDSYVGRTMWFDFILILLISAYLVLSLYRAVSL